MKKKTEALAFFHFSAPGVNKLRKQIRKKKTLGIEKLKRALVRTVQG